MATATTYASACGLADAIQNQGQHTNWQVALGLLVKALPDQKLHHAAS